MILKKIAYCTGYVRKIYVENRYLWLTTTITHIHCKSRRISIVPHVYYTQFQHNSFWCYWMLWAAKFFKSYCYWSFICSCKISNSRIEHLHFSHSFCVAKAFIYRYDHQLIASCYIWYRNSPSCPTKDVWTCTSFVINAQVTALNEQISSSR